MSGETQKPGQTQLLPVPSGFPFAVAGSSMARETFFGAEGMHQIFMGHTQREEPYLYIGKVAELTGASRKAIRHYEAMGLLPPAMRRGKYRIYSERDVFLVHMIKHAQSYGFNLAELGGLVTAKMKNNRFPLRVANALIERKRKTLRQEMAALGGLEQRLLELKAEMNRMFG